MAERPIIHPQAIEEGEPLAVPTGDGVYIVRGAAKAREAALRGDESMKTEMVLGFEGNDGVKRFPTPEEAIDMLHEDLPGFRVFDGEIQHG